MKRNLFCLLLALTLTFVAVFAAPAAFATEGESEADTEQTTPAHSHCECGGLGTVGDHTTCEAIVYDKVLSDASFVSYTYDNSSMKDTTTSVIPSGNYYLEADTTITKTLYVKPGETVNLCLNGYKLTSQQLKPNGNLTICDCSAEGTGQVYADYKSSSPVFYTYSGSDVKIYGGTYSSVAPDTGRHYAGCFSVARDYGVQDCDLNDDGTADNKGYFDSAMTIYAGKFIGSDLTYASGTLYGGGRGACGVVMHSECTLNIYGGEFIGGKTISAEKGGLLGGGVIYNAGQLNIFGGKFTNSQDPIGAIHSYTATSACTVSGAPVFENNLNCDFSGKPLTIGEAGLSSAISVCTGTVTLQSEAEAELISVPEGYAKTVDGTTVTITKTGCVCGGKLTDAVKQQSGHVCTDATWLPLNSETVENYFSLTSNKYYLKDTELYLYLTGDYQLPYHIEIATGKALHIDTNGYLLSDKPSDTSTFRVYGALSICASSITGSGRVTGTRTGSGEGSLVYLLNANGTATSGYTYYTPRMDLYGSALSAKNQKSTTSTTTTYAAKAGVIHVGNNSAEDCSNATFNMYGGKVTGSTTYRGGVMYVQGSVFNLYDGQIIGGTANRQATTKTDSTTGESTTTYSYGYGGGIMVVSRSTFNMYGGTISGGKAYLGGSLYITDATVTANLMGGTISGGTATYNCGNVYVTSGAKVEISGTKLLNGTASNRGGNVYVTTQTTEVTINDADITGGTAKDRGGNVYMDNGTVTINGGTITGGTLTARQYGADIAMGAPSNDLFMTLNGKMTIGEIGAYGNKSARYSIALGEDFSSDTPIKLSAANQDKVLKNVPISARAYFVAADAEDQITYEYADSISYICLRDASLDYHCRCGGNADPAALALMKHSCYDALWKSLTQESLDALKADTANITSDTLSDGNVLILPAGYYRLDEDIVTDMPLFVKLGTTVGLDLNGHTVTGNIPVSEDPAINKPYTTIIRGTFHLSDSAYDASNADAKRGKIIGQGTIGGSALYVCGYDKDKGNETYLFGGELTTAAEKAACSGPLAISGRCNQVDALITGHETTASGGAIAMNDSAVLNVWGGTIVGGDAKYGGAIYMGRTNQKLNIYGGTITGGKASIQGGNIYGTVINISGGTVTGGKSQQHGGNIYTYSTTTISGGLIEKGESLSESHNGGNICVSGGTTTIKGDAVIADGAAREGGNLSVRSTGVLNIAGGVVKNGYARNHGGNIAAFTTLNISGGEIFDGTAVYRGGNISTYANKGKITITGGKIYDGILTGKDEDGDGAIDQLPSELYGANITMNAALETTPISLTMTGGTIGGFGEGCVEGVTSVHVGSSGAETTVTLGGTAVIDQLRLGTARMITVHEDGFADGASIGIERFEISGLFAPEAAAEAAEYFHATWEGATVEATEEGLILVSSIPYYAFNEEHTLVGSANSIKDAMALDGATYVRLVADYTTDEVIEGDLYLDLYGHDLTGLTVNGKLYLVDYKGNEYEEGVLGSLIGATVQELQTFYSSDREHFNAVRHYVVLENADGSYSAHRVGVTLAYVNLKAAADALGYKAQIMADSAALQAITSYGFNLSTEDCIPKTYTVKETPTDSYITLRLKGIMANGGGETDITGSAFICIGDNVIETSTYVTNMKQTILKVNAMEGLSDAQKESVYGLYEQYKDVMDAWFGEATNNIATWAPVTEEPTPEPTDPETGDDTTTA